MMYLNDRWRVLPGADTSAAQLLDNLIDAQEFVAEEELAMVASEQGRLGEGWLELMQRYPQLRRFVM